MSFKFSLETLLRYRKTIESREETRLLLANQQVHAMQSRIETVESELRRRQTDVRLGLEQGLSGAELGFQQACEIALEQHRSALFQKLASLELVRDEQRMKFQTARRQRLTLDQLRAVRAGVVDVGLVRPPIEDDGELRVQTVLRERTVAAVPAGHELAALSRVPLRRLAAEPLVLFPREQAPGFHDLLIDSLAGAGVARPGGPRVIQYAPEMLTIIGLVAAGAGVSLVPASVQRLALDGVSYRPVPGAPLSELVAVTRAGDHSALVRDFVSEATDGSSLSRPATRSRC